MHRAWLFVGLASISGCFLDRHGLVDPGGDGGSIDGGALEDGGRIDAGMFDAGRVDAGMTDAGTCDPTAPPGCSGDDVEMCVGGVIESSPCMFGCALGACQRILPSNVGDRVAMDAGTRD